MDDFKQEEKKEKKEKKEVVIDFKKLTTKDIIKLAKKPEKPYFSKKQLCKLLEKDGYKVIY